VSKRPFLRYFRRNKIKAERTGLPPNIFVSARQGASFFDLVFGRMLVAINFSAFRQRKKYSELAPFSGWFHAIN
jgi:hypothetical protein